MYNSEIWLAYKTCYQKKTLDEMFDISFKGFNEFNKLHTRFCKFVLGVHSKAMNFAVYSELGRFPLIIGGIASCISYWLHVICSNRENLASKAYLEQFNSSGEKYAWLNFVKRVLCHLGFSHVWNNQSTFNISSFLLSIKNKLKERYISYWNNRINSNNGMDKLRTYKLFKKTFGLEEYLEYGLDRKYRQCLSSFRISPHKLQIERGRYIGKNVEERKCTDCNVIEDEIHFFCDCHKYNNSREKLYLELGNQHLFLGNDSKDKLINILTSKKYGVIKPVCRYLYECNIC